MRNNRRTKGHRKTLNETGEGLTELKAIIEERQYKTGRNDNKEAQQGGKIAKVVIVLETEELRECNIIEWIREEVDI